MTLKSRRVKRPSAMLDEAAVVRVGGWVVSTTTSSALGCARRERERELGYR